MLLTGDSSFNIKGRRVCLATFNLQSIPAACMLKPTLEEPLKSEDDLQQSRSRLSSTREESLHQVSLMAGTRVLGPSDAPCLVKSSTAHGDLLLWITFSSIGVIKLSGFPSYDSTLAQNPRMSHLPSPKLSAPPQNLPVLPFSRRAQIYFVPTKEKLGFPLVGSPNFGPIRLLKPKYNRCNPSLSLQKPRSALKIILSILSLRLCRLSKEIVRRQQLKRKSPLVLWMYKNSMRTLPLDSSRLISHEPKSLKKNGSMVSSIKPSIMKLNHPRFILSTLLLPIRHCLGSLVDLDVRRLHLRLRLPRMFGIYLDYDRILVNAPSVTLFETSYQAVCLNLLLVPSAPSCQLLPQGRRLGSDLNSQGQPDYKLCVEFLNLHGQWLHVREDPPALLRLVTLQMRFPVSSSPKATSPLQPSKPLVSSVEHTFKSSNAYIVRANYDHLLVRDFMKLVFKLESHKTSKDLPSFASSSRLCIFLEDSWSLYLSISCNLLLLSCKNTPLLRF